MAEETSALTEHTMFIHDEPNWEAVDLEATRVGLLCAYDGKADISPEDCPLVGYHVNDETEAMLTQLTQTSYTAITVPA